MARLLLLLLAGCTSAPLAAAQRDVRAAEAYLAHVLRYRAGEYGQVTGALATWSQDDLRLALRGLPAALVSVSRKERIGQPTLVGNAMAMHAHIARNAESAAEIARHLSIGQRLSDLLPVDDAAQAFRARWHLVAGTIVLSLSRPAEALPHFEVARELRPEDPAILLAVGSVHEMQASVGARSKASGVDATGRLREVLELYAAALSRAPDLHEARLRLARIHHLLGDVESAARLIEAIDRAATDAHLRYLTLLIEGSIAEAAGLREQAIAKYSQARASCRGCQSATLALSQAFVRTGKRVVAQELIEHLLDEDVWPLPADPWWVYQQGQWHSVDRLLDQLRREVPK